MKKTQFLTVFIVAALSMPFAIYGQPIKSTFPCPPVVVHAHYCDGDHEDCDPCNNESQVDIFDFSDNNDGGNDDEKETKYGLSLGLVYNNFQYADNRASDFVGVTASFHRNRLFVGAAGGIGRRSDEFPASQAEGWQLFTGYDIVHVEHFRASLLTGYAHYGEALKESSTLSGFSRGEYALDYDTFFVGGKMHVLNALTASFSYGFSGERDLPFEVDRRDISGLQFTIGFEHKFAF